MPPKKLEEYAYEELINLSPEMLSALMDESRNQHIADSLEKSTNPTNLSFDQKVEQWAGELGRQMRYQAEWGLDEYAMFTPEWYANAKIQEPLLDDIMNAVFGKFLSWEWDKNEYLRRISGQ